MSLPTLWPLAVLVAVLPSKMIGSVPVKITFPRPITGLRGSSEILEVIAITPPPRVAVLFLMITSLIVTVPLA